MNMLRLFSILILFSGLIVGISAQKKAISAETDFDEYDRNISQTSSGTKKPSRPIKTQKPISNGGSNQRGKKQFQNQFQRRLKVLVRPE